jgi:hypothetical protein
MASELRVNTLKDAAGSNEVAMEYVANGSAKAWVAELNGSASAAASFNFSSFTDNGDDNTATFTNAMTAEYAVVCSAEEANTTPVARYVMVFNRGAGSFKMATYTDSGGLSSVPQHAIIQGDLA